MHLTDLNHNIIVYNILVPFIIHSAPTFKDAVQPIINLNATSKYFKTLLKESNHKSVVDSTLINKLEDTQINVMLSNIKTEQEAQQTLLIISKSSGLFLDQYHKRSSQDFRYMNKFVVALLKQKGACVNSGTTPDNSPLFITIEHHDKSYFVEALLAHGAFPNQRNENGTTPLMIARRHGKYNACIILSKYGANKDAQDNEGHTMYSDVYA